MSAIKTMVHGTYDIQKLRIQMGNRIVGNFKAKLGQQPGNGEDTLDEESRVLLAKIRGENKLVTTGAIAELDAEKVAAKEEKLGKLVTELVNKHYAAFINKKEGIPSKAKFVGNPVISDYTELCLIDQYKSLEKQEARHFRSLGGALEDYPVFVNFLTSVRGIGPAMAGVIVSEIDITKCKYASSLWMYAGLDVAPVAYYMNEKGKRKYLTGEEFATIDPADKEPLWQEKYPVIVESRGRSKVGTHLVIREYVDREGESAKRESITFNPFLKTKLMGVLAASFLRSGNERYVKIYSDYKNRIENHPMWKTKTKGHRHNAALRYMIKQFLVDLYVAWRKLENLPVEPSYQEAKLGHKHAA